MANPAHPVPTEISSISFGFLTSEQVRRISVKQITNPVLFDALNNPTANGLYDPALGPTQRGDICKTCRLTSFDCPGHFGHIDLPAPVFHPLFITQVYNLLRGSCHHCHHFLLPPALVAQYAARLMLLERGLAADADAIAGITMKVARQLARHKRDNIEEQGDDTEAETLMEYKARLWKTITDAVKRERNANGGQIPNRDSFKNQICFDKRKVLIAEFLKLITSKKRCYNCNANHHRMRKEGHTKIIAFSLTSKQQLQDELAGIQRDNILLRMASQATKKQKKASSRSKDAVNAKQLRHDSEEESEQGYNDHEIDSDHDSSDPDGPNGRAPSPASSEEENSDATSDTSLEDEAKEDNALEPMELDEEEQAELAADTAGVIVDVEAGASSRDGQKEKGFAQARAKQTERIMTAQECREHIRLLFEVESEICALIYGSHGPVATRIRQELPKDAAPAPVSGDLFFLDVVTVPPSRFRPPASMGDMTFESPANELLSNVLKAVITIRDRNEALRQGRVKKPLAGDGIPGPIVDTVRLYGLLIEAVINLQVAVNSFMDSTKNPMQLRGGKEPPMGIKQVLEKKEGLFRKNMMGKRVNYAARSVISPDINIETNEIGVPPVFAKKLTFPEPVTPHNFSRLRQLVINGPDVHPGAAYIEMEDGSLTALSSKNEQDRTSLANQLMTPSTSTYRPHGRPDVGLPTTRTPQLNRKVYRHLDDGDILILNRQPTLHKPSMMCHRAKILKGEKTIRMHYANCNSYNADFDGDEMNMHFPQSHIAQAEAKLIADTDNQYLVPTSGNPLRGLIQDHVVAGTWMTNKDIFFTREEYYQLIYGALRPENNSYAGQGRVVTIPPAVWKPRPMWTGKQIITTIVKNITPPGAAGLHMSSKSKVPGDAWGLAHKEEGTVLFYDGTMLTGCLDKSQFGATAYGLVHSTYELYGKETAGKLLGILSRLFTNYLQHRAFSCRMDDLLLTPEGNAIRAKRIEEADERGYKAALSVVGLDKEDPNSPDTLHNMRLRLEEVLRDDNKLAGLDAFVSSKMGELSSAVIKETLPNGLVKPFPHNNMQTMTISGAKGSNVNASQISSLLGQQSLEGRRVPVMVSGKTLPSFRPFETAPRAGGYVAQRFLTGIRPQEYYFHCMAGREGLIDTAVKTSRSGYLQRCLIKHLEGIKVNYDNTVRNADQSVIQFNYGEDSLDVTRQKSLTQFEFAARNYRSLINRFKPNLVGGRLNEEDAAAHMKSTLKRVAHAPILSTGFPALAGLPDPTLSLLSPAKYLGSTSEAFAVRLGQYTAENPQKLLRGKKKDRATWAKWETLPKEKQLEPEMFKTLMNLRYMRSLVDPGEAVGLLASQGVGEPSTQMTLNTFHFAGHGAANVTLGIPRLREIVMTASASIKTPTMRLQVRPEVTQERMEHFCKSASKVTLSQIVEEVTVDQRLSSKTAQNAYSRETIYTVHMKFYPQTEYEQEFRTNSEEILRSLYGSFCAQFDKAILKAMKTASKGAKLSDVGKAQKGDGHQRTETGDDIDGGDAVLAAEDEMALPARNQDDEELDMDADDERRAKQSKDTTMYGEDDEDTDDENGNKKKTSKLPIDSAAFEAMYATGSEDEADADGDDDDDSSDVGSEDIDAAGGEALSKREKKLQKTEQRDRMTRLENIIPSRSKFVQKVSFDKEAGEWCDLELQFTAKQPKLLLVGIVEECCRIAVVHQAPGITRCFEAAPEAGAKPDDPKFCVTEGVNLSGTWSFADGIIDMNTIYTNDIAAVLRTYGVEAARTVLIREIQGVFGVYGIGVDRRHLTLIADYMTCEGGYKPFNRTGIANSPSPFLKASFETTAGFISDATLFGDFEDLSSPSASIVLGKVAQTGTGIFQVALPVA